MAVTTRRILFGAHERSSETPRHAGQFDKPQDCQRDSARDRTGKHPGAQESQAVGDADVRGGSTNDHEEHRPNETIRSMRIRR
jgi:hypothetical protein